MNSTIVLLLRIVLSSAPTAHNMFDENLEWLIGLALISEYINTGLTTDKHTAKRVFQEQETGHGGSDRLHAYVYSLDGVALLFQISYGHSIGAAITLKVLIITILIQVFTAIYIVATA
ncbi:hypothetical protein VNO78_32505 [Psophocarpus tetragonolobus]|uniref:Uncharacterized protein n=1 Tax=Psophocarpus tetragonolobus TaxID=3891 RepID=A0AAN9NVG8_PSOTE